MEYKQVLRQMITFNKTTFDNSFRTLKMVQEQNEKLLGSFLDQATWVPEEGKRVINDWIKASQKGADDFKKYVDENYKKVEAFFSLE